MLAAPQENRTVKKIIAILLMLAVLLVPSPASASSSIEIVDRVGDGTWIGDTWQVNVYPGESKATTLTLYNSSSESAEVELTIIPESLDNGNLLFELDETTFTMPGKSYADVTLTVKASASVTPGTYTSELSIEAVSAPSVTTSKARGVGTRQATLNGILTSLGTASSVAVSFGWDTKSHAEDATAYANWTPSEVKTGTGTFKVRVTGLTPGMTYYFRAKTEGDGTTYGSELSFTTNPRGRWWWLEWLFPWLKG